MKKMEKALLPVSVVLVVGVCALWVGAQQKSTRLARELGDKNAELRAAQAARQGLEEANNRLHSRIETLQQTAARAAENPREITDDLVRVQEENWQVLPGVVETPVEGGRDRDRDRQPTVMTPEQLAEQEEREKRREEWRQEMAKRREEFRDRALSEIETRREFFGRINTQGLAPEYKESHTKLMQSLDKVEELMNAVNNPELSSDERRQIGMQLWGASREIQGLMSQQRDVLLSDYAQANLGLAPEDTRQFMEYMQTVNEMTGSSIMRGPPPGRGPDGGGDRGGGGR